MESSAWARASNSELMLQGSVLGTGRVFAAIATLGGTTGCPGDDECLPEGNNCRESYLKKDGKAGISCCNDNECCYLRNGITVPMSNPSHRCE